MKTEARILIAEDEPDMLRGLERALLYEGYRVEPAGNGIEAAEKLERRHFDVVVSDLKMPVVDGMDLLHIAKKKDRQTVFIMITAFGTPENAVEAMRLGSFEYLAKPFPASELVAAIERGLSARGSEDAVSARPAPKITSIYRDAREHTWVSPQPDGTVVVGADEEFFAEAGEIIYCDLPLEGEKLEKGQRCVGTISSDRHILKHLHSPLSGTVVEVNPRMEGEPWEVQGLPYGQGWLFRLAPSRLDEELEAR